MIIMFFRQNKLKYVLKIFTNSFEEFVSFWLKQIIAGITTVKTRMEI